MSALMLRVAMMPPILETARPVSRQFQSRPGDCLHRPPALPPIKIILLTRCRHLVTLETLHQKQFFTLLKQSDLRGFVFRSVFSPNCTVTFLTLEQTRR